MMGLAVLSTNMALRMFSALVFSKNKSLSAFSPASSLLLQLSRSIPAGSKTILRELEIPITLKLSLKCSLRKSRCWFTCSRNLLPTLPIPVTKRCSFLICASKNAS